MNSTNASSVLNEKYEFIDKKASALGAFGEIYRIRDKKVKTEFVLKKLKKSDPNNPNILGTNKETFDNEKKFLIDVKGTNILNIIDYYEGNDDYYYFVFEKMDGDLQQLIDTKYKNGMSSQMIRKIFSQVNSGLKIMQKLGKSHRDLKPSNILFSYVDDKEKDFIVKIGDFGLATDLSSKNVTATDCGTIVYKAPEVESGKFNNKCDLYSLGIILYLLKTGKIIFEGNSMREIIINQFQNKRRKETDDKKLNDLINKLVVTDPEKRMNWDAYFEHPFFKEIDDESKNKFNKISFRFKKRN